MLTQYLSWRWCLYVNLIFAGFGIAAALTLLHNVTPEQRTRIDIPGTLLATTGLFTLVYGFSHASTSSWTNKVTLGLLAAGVLLLIGFVLVEARVHHPLLPLRVVLHRDRGGSYLAVALSAIAIFAVFLFLTYYLQQGRGYTPIGTGVAFLPISLAVILSAVIATKLRPRVGPRPLAVTGCCSAAVGCSTSPG